MNDFTPWSLLIDIGIISGLLLLGKLIRARVGFIQRLLIPPSLIAGSALKYWDGCHCLPIWELMPVCLLPWFSVLCH
jgi:hypothetical protein